MTDINDSVQLQLQIAPCPWAGRVEWQWQWDIRWVLHIISEIKYLLRNTHCSHKCYSVLGYISIVLCAYIFICARQQVTEVERVRPFSSILVHDCYTCFRSYAVICRLYCISYWILIVVPTVVYHTALNGRRNFIYFPCRDSTQDSN